MYMYMEVILYSKECNWYTRCCPLNGGVRYREYLLREAILYMCAIDLMPASRTVISKINKVSFLFIKDNLPTSLVLFRNNVTSSLFTSGIMKVYGSSWGNICYDYSFGANESHVVCHQLGYTGASSYSRAGLTKYSVL